VLLRKAIFSDLPEIKSLWKAVFLDSDDYIHSFISHFGVEAGYVCEINNAVAAMAFALPTALSYHPHLSIINYQLPIIYVYACATHPQYRRQGIMEKLLKTVYDDACCENIAGIFLQAADANLMSYYRKLEFEDFFYEGETIFFLNYKGHKENTKGAMEFIAPDVYYTEREQRLEKLCFVNWGNDFFRFLSETGQKFCMYEDAIFSFRAKDKTIIVDELLGNVPALQIASLLFERFPDFESIEIRTVGNDRCCGQIKWGKLPCSTLSNGYFAFAMES